jgi:PilZ domain-containing protein
MQILRKLAAGGLNSGGSESAHWAIWHDGMSLNGNSLLPFYGDSEPMRGDQNNSLSGFERRNRQRISLHWNVYIIRETDSGPLLSRTKNLSSEGFYCIVEKPFTPGEHFYCDIFIPAHGVSIQSSGISLHCRIQVLRVEATRGGYGLACRIEEYSVSRWKP